MIVNILQFTELNQADLENLLWKIQIQHMFSLKSLSFIPSLGNLNLLDRSCRFHSPASGCRRKLYQLPHGDF